MQEIASPTSLVVYGEVGSPLSLCFTALLLLGAVALVCCTRFLSSSGTQEAPTTQYTHITLSAGTKVRVPVQ